MSKRDPFRPVDPEARTLVRGLIDGTTYAAIAVLDQGQRAVTRIAFAIV